MSLYCERLRKRTVGRKLQNLFETGTYNNSRSSDSRKGMGIGLSICKTIITAHHGTLSGRNHADGAEFCFTLPKIQERIWITDMNKIKVLLIEDDRSISNFITATMDREGYKIMHALNGREGLSLSTSFCPNVILLDLGLPDMDGLEVLQKLRSWSDVPVIIISARTKEQEKVSALDLGADDYITKPFGTGELMARIRTSLRHSHAQTPGHVYKALDLEIDFEKRLIRLRGEEVHLTQIEYQLLTL